MGQGQGQGSVASREAVQLNVSMCGDDGDASGQWPCLMVSSAIDVNVNMMRRTKNIKIEELLCTYGIVVTPLGLIMFAKVRRIAIFARHHIFGIKIPS